MTKQIEWFFVTFLCLCTWNWLSYFQRHLKLHVIVTNLFLFFFVRSFHFFRSHIPCSFDTFLVYLHLNEIVLCFGCLSLYILNCPITNKKNLLTRITNARCGMPVLFFFFEKKKISRKSEIKGPESGRKRKHSWIYLTHQN